MRAVSPSENPEGEGTVMEEEFRRALGEGTKEIFERERERERSEKKQCEQKRGRRSQCRARGKLRSTTWTTESSGVGAPTE